MKDNEFKKGIEAIKEIKLGDKEKNSILESVLGASVVSPYAPKESTWVKSARNERRLSNFWASIAVAGALTTLIVYNAESSLPGDVLYNIKVNVSEPVRNILNLTPENRAEWESVKAIRRLEEAADLVAKGRLDHQNRVDLEALFNKHVDSFNESLLSLPTSTLQTDLITTEFEANISARSQVLDSLDKNLDGEMSTTTSSSTDPNSLTAATSTSTDSLVATSTSATTSTTTSTTTEDNNRDKQREEKENRAELKKLKEAVSKKLEEARKLNSQFRYEDKGNQESETENTD